MFDVEYVVVDALTASVVDLKRRCLLLGDFHCNR